jgi:HK97 family phage major capsid protein
MKFKIKYPFLFCTLALLVSVFIGFNLGVFSPGKAIAFLFLGQMAMFCLSRPQLALFITALSPSQVEEFEELTREMKDSWQDVRAMLKEFPDLKGSIQKLRRTMAVGGGVGNSGVHWIGNVPFVTDDCARALTSIFVVECDGIKALETLVKDSGTRQRVLGIARETLGITQRTALSTTEIPVPTIYAPQIIELVFRFGQARQFATVFPLGAGTVKLPRLKAGEDDFGYIGIGTAGMSQPIGEKRPATELVTFTANKFGGLIRIPYELEEDTFVPIGQFLARYIARQLAKGEDKTLFLADGTAAYANQTGVGPYCVANTDYLLQMDAAKTKVSDITLDDLRNLRGKVSPAVLADMAANGQTDAAYYFHPTMEPLIRGFNKYPNFIVFENVNGKPMFDGWPVRWIGVGASNNGQAQPGTFAAFFGALSYWYLGERGSVRVEVSKEVFFATDELAMRALERIDVEALAVDAMAAIRTGAGA